MCGSTGKWISSENGKQPKKIKFLGAVLSILAIPHNKNGLGQQAAIAQGEADRITMVAKATAERQSKILQGEGIAGEREAIIEGLKKSVEDLAAATGVDPQDAMNMVVLTQYFDTLVKVAGGNNSNTILLPLSPSAIPGFLDEIRNAITVGNVASERARALKG